MIIERENKQKKINKIVFKKIDKPLESWLKKTEDSNNNIRNERGAISTDTIGEKRYTNKLDVRRN